MLLVRFWVSMFAVFQHEGKCLSQSIAFVMFSRVIRLDGSLFSIVLCIWSGPEAFLLLK